MYFQFCGWCHIFLYWAIWWHDAAAAMLIKCARANTPAAWYGNLRSVIRTIGVGSWMCSAHFLVDVEFFNKIWIHFCCMIQPNAAATVFHHAATTGVGRLFLRNAESCQGIICRKSSAERCTNYTPYRFSAFRSRKMQHFLRIAKLPFARIVQQMCNRCIATSGVPRSLAYTIKGETRAHRMLANVLPSGNVQQIQYGGGNRKQK